VTARPFTVPHFTRFASELILDSGEPWVLDPWQLDWIRDVFKGYKQNWLIVPEENGKTTLFGGLALYHVRHWNDVPGRRRAQPAYAPIAASSREQAEWAYLQAEGLVLRSGLSREFRCYGGYRRILHKPSQGRIQIHAADDRTGDGIIPTMWFIDELHRHRDLALLRTWVGKLDKRPGAQGCVISTAGEPDSEFELAREEIRRSALKVRRRRCFVRAETSSVMMHEYAVPPDGDVENMKLVKAANPLSRITVESLQAKHDAPTMLVPHWKRFVCNIATRDASAAIQEREWERSEVREWVPAGKPIWVGLDLGWKWDTTAIVPFHAESKEDRLIGPSIILEPPRDGSSLDSVLIESALLRLHHRNPIHTVVMDETRGEQLARWIEAELGAMVVARGTGNADAAVDYEKFTEALRLGWLHHVPDLELKRHVLNAVARMLQENKARFERPASNRTLGRRADPNVEHRRRVIDGLVAAAMVNSVAGENLGRAKREPMVSWA